ncbi:ESF2/ABP1 family protein, partial [Phenoliferia sp. Uapishka_3]
MGLCAASREPFDETVCLLVRKRSRDSRQNDICWPEVDPVRHSGSPTFSDVALALSTTRMSSPKASASKRARPASDDGEEDGNDALTAPTSLPAHLLPKSSTSSKTLTPGIIYLSRLPPGLGPAKVKHLLSAYGEVGRVFLARSDPDPLPSQTRKQSFRGRPKEKHKEHRFAEGWVEYTDKRVARSVADLLNANTIGGKKGSRWRDDVWTMKYLPKFRWDMLSEQVALERATQTSLLRFHLQSSKTEQESYLEAVEKARVKDAIVAKAEGRKGKEGSNKKAKVDGAVAGEGEKKEKKERERKYRQREVVDSGAKAAKAGEGKVQLDGVLGRLF